MLNRRVGLSREVNVRTSASADTPTATLNSHRFMCGTPVEKKVNRQAPESAKLKNETLFLYPLLFLALLAFWRFNSSFYIRAPHPTFPARRDTRERGKMKKRVYLLKNSTFISFSPPGLISTMSGSLSSG